MHPAAVARRAAALVAAAAAWLSGGELLGGEPPAMVIRQAASRGTEGRNERTKFRGVREQHARVSTARTCAAPPCPLYPAWC